MSSKKEEPEYDLTSFHCEVEAEEEEEEDEDEEDEDEVLDTEGALDPSRDATRVFFAVACVLVVTSAGGGDVDLGGASGACLRLRAVQTASDSSSVLERDESDESEDVEAVDRGAVARTRGTGCAMMVVVVAAAFVGGVGVRASFGFCEGRGIMK